MTKTHVEINSYNKGNKPDLTFQYPLYFISVLTGLSPPFDLQRYRTKKSYLHKIYSILLVVGIIYVSLISGIGRYNYAYKFLLQTVRINDMIQEILLTISSVYPILNVTLRGRSKLDAYFEKLRNIDTFLSTAINLRRIKLLYYIRFFVYHAIIISLTISDYLAWSYAMGYDLWLLYSFRLFLFYLNMIIVLQITSFACSVQLRFGIVNERLLDTFIQWFNEYEQRTRRRIKIELCPRSYTITVFKDLSIRSLISIHDSLCDVVEILNDLYGFNFFLLVSNIIVNCVMSLNIMMIFGTGIQVAKNKGLYSSRCECSVGYFFYGK